jgi:predicted transposase/invertase (TIGR01784 family)
MAMKLVRFDWAMKHLLRDKANYSVLEGFLSVLLNEKVRIMQILSSQSNQETDNDKYNDVDVLVENTKGELVIIEVQNTKEYDYFHRILYGTSKAISEYINEGQPYSDVKKVISITIAYFDLGQGEDYVYHGTNTFRGMHKNDVR